MHTNNTEKKALMTRHQAAKWIRTAKSGVRFYLHASADQRIEGNDLEYYPGAARLTIDLSRIQALKIVESYLTDKAEAEGRRIPTNEYRSEHDGVKEYVAYWIG
jgi:hypothetical protein